MFTSVPWKGPAPSDYPYKINRKNRLADSLVFAYAGHLGLDSINGLRPTKVNVTEGTGFNKRSWSFAGGAAGSSELDFGTPVFTASMGMNPSSWAFLATVDSASDIALACHSDNNVDAGWQIGTQATSGVGLSCPRGTSNVQAFAPIVPTANVPFTLVVTYDGGNLASGIKLYFNGVQIAANSSQNGSGTALAATAEHLYLGRHRFNNAINHNGLIMVALMATRQWSDAEARSFHNDPYAVFQTDSKLIFSFSPLTASLINGSASIVFGQSGSLGTQSNIFGTSNITFGQTGSLVNSGLIGTSHIVIGESGFITHGGHVGDFDYVPCDDCTVGAPPQVINVIPGSGVTINAGDSVQFDVIDLDSAMRRIIVYAQYPNKPLVEIIHTGDGFAPIYASGSTRTVIPNGFRYKVTRSKPWPDVLINMTVDAIDVTGQED